MPTTGGDPNTSSLMIDLFLSWLGGANTDMLKPMDETSALQSFANSQNSGKPVAVLGPKPVPTVAHQCSPQKTELLPNRFWPAPTVVLVWLSESIDCNGDTLSSLFFARKLHILRALSPAAEDRPVRQKKGFNELIQVQHLHHVTT